METASPPDHLTAEERQSWFALSAVMIKLPFALDTRLQREAGLSLFEFHVLSVLAEAPDQTMRMSDLAVFANGSLSRLSHVVNRLERRAWTRRTPDPDDGRYNLAILTDAGREKVEQAAPDHYAAVRELVFDGLTAAQARQLGDIGHRVIRAIDPDDHCLDFLAS
ncbi:MAG: MarR family transcriptional regulator [Hamadaea sp.]|nr:MarR family transcriptional regulator [Hamadaea sp.]